MRARPLITMLFAIGWAAVGPVSATAPRPASDGRGPMLSRGLGDVVTVCPVADPFITPAQGPPVGAITREADSLRVELTLAGAVPAPGLSVWGIEVIFDETKLGYVRTERSSFTNSGDWPQFAGNLVSGTTNQVIITAAVGVQPPSPPSDPEILAIIVFSVLNLVEEGPAQFDTIHLTGDFGTEAQFLQLDVQPCPFELTFDARGTGDVDPNLVFTPRDARCTENGATELDIIPKECIESTPPPPNLSNLAPIERYEADVDCSGYLTSLDADAIFDAVFCPGVVPDTPCFAAPGFSCRPARNLVVTEYRAFAHDKRLRLGPARRLDDNRWSISFEVVGSGNLEAFALDFLRHPEVELLGVEPSPVMAAWRRYAHSDLSPDVVRVAGYDLDGFRLSEVDWTTLGYFIVRGPDHLIEAAEPFELVGSMDDLEGVPLVRNPAGETAGEVARFALGAAWPNPARGEVTIGYVVPEGPAVDVTIEIFNVRGQRLRTLVSGRHGPGAHEANWDGLDIDGRRVAAGAYFYRMRSGSFERTRKLVINR